MVTLAPLDIAVFIAFIGAILALGFSAKLRQNTVLEYLTAGRSLSLPAFVATLVSTWYGGILGVGESVSYYGFGAWLLIGVPYYLFAIAYALWLAPKVRDAHQISIPERFANRWGRNVGLLAAVLIFILAVPAAHVLMLGSLIAQFTGLALPIAVIIGALIGLALLYRGGLLADVRMCLLAFVGMYVGFACMTGYCILNFPPAETLAKIQDKNLLTFTGGVPWTVIVTFMILGAWTFVDPAFHQRVASASSPEVGRKGILVSVFFWLVFDLLSIGAAMYALALLNPLPETLAIYPALAEKVLPPGLKALFLCGALGTIASAMVAYTLVSGATVGREFAARLMPDLSEGQQKKWIRFGLVLALCVAVPVALAVNSVVELWYSWAGAVVGAMVLPVLISYRPTSKVHPSVIFASMAIAATSSIVWLVYGLRTNNAFLEVICLKIDGAWHFVMAPGNSEMVAKATETLNIGIGTLLPGLVISAVTLAIGKVAIRKD
ncbi:sodium:solute symporter family protein [soil metagenome]